MRLLIAPDGFKGTLRADEAAAAIARGWRRARPTHELVERPLSDGGPGFVHAMASARGVEVRHTGTRHAVEGLVDAAWCIDGTTAFLEAAQVVGVDRGLDVQRATSIGLASIVRDAIAAGARTIVVGLGGTACVDGGAGLLAGLGATAHDSLGESVPLDAGPSALSRIATVDLEPALRLLADVELVAAVDVDVPLLGARGAVLGFAPQKGARAEDLPALEAAIATFAAACGRRADGKDAAVMLGAGAAGGLGFALLRLGGVRASGLRRVWDDSRIDLDGIDLVITGEGSLDWQSLEGKVVAGVAMRAQERGIPVIAIAGRVLITPRERIDLGLDAAYSLTDMFGEERATSDAAGALADAAERLVRTWG